jgi:hypothetical protein
LLDEEVREGGMESLEFREGRSGRIAGDEEVEERFRQAGEAREWSEKGKGWDVRRMYAPEAKRLKNFLILHRQLVDGRDILENSGDLTQPFAVNDLLLDTRPLLPRRLDAIRRPGSDVHASGAAGVVDELALGDIDDAKTEGGVSRERGERKRKAHSVSLGTTDPRSKNAAVSR